MKVNWVGWTLFLDRDGVINRRLIDEYVRNWDAFEFLPDFLETIPFFSTYFARIVIITNQQGVGKGLMSLENVHQIHEKLCAQVDSRGGRIDGIYVCPHLKSDNCSCRKPAIGMGLQAKAAFPDIDFSRSIFIGDSESDIECGNEMGTQTILLSSNIPAVTKANFVCKDLEDVKKGLII